MPVNVFGGGPVQTAQVQFRQIDLFLGNTDPILVWPTTYADNPNVIANYMSVNATVADCTITLPAANQTSVGQSFIITNLGTFDFTLLKSDGSTLLSITAGKSFYFILTDNSNAVGTWQNVTFGAGTSSADASALAGAGLVDLPGDPAQLNVDINTTNLSTNHTITVNDRAKLFVWTGGTGTITLPKLLDAPNGFFFCLNNTGSGALNIIATETVNIDGSLPPFILNPGQSLTMVRGEGGYGWSTLGFGRTSSVPVKSLNLDVSIATAGTLNLSPSQASFIIQQYFGVLTANTTIIFPAQTGYWFIQNKATAFALSVKSSGVSASINIPSGSNKLVYSAPTTTNIIEMNLVPSP